MQGRLGWLIPAVLIAGCGKARPPTPRPAVASVAAASAATRYQIPWPAEAKDARPVASEAAAVALVQTFIKAHRPEYDPASYRASLHDQEWLVNVGRLPATPGGHVLVVVSRAGRVLEIIAGE